MSIKNTIAKFKSRFGRPTFLVNPTSPISEAFVSGGVMYYQFEDIFTMPCQRSFEATTYYEEMKSRISKEYLTEYLEAMTKVLSDPKGINVSKVAILTNHLKERSELIVDSDIVYKLASVMYFDKNENPYAYDMKYNHIKIKKWKEEQDVESFFLQTPIRNFLPFTDILESDLSNYLKVASQVSQEHWSYLSSILSEKIKS